MERVAMKSLTADDFDSLYRQYGPMVLRRCRFLLRNEEAAVDAMQDVFLRLFERKEKLSVVGSSFFYTVATRVCLNKLRSSKRNSPADVEVILTEISSNAEQNHEDVVDASIILDAIFSDEKDDKTKQIAVLHYVDGMTLAETAEYMKMSVSGIRKRLEKLKSSAKNYGC